MVEEKKYRIGVRTGNLVMSESFMLEKHKYLQDFMSNRNLPDEERLREFYMDESYIHEH